MTIWELDPKNFGHELKQIRKHRRMTERELGDLCSAPAAQSAVSKYEAGERCPTLKTLVEMAAALGIDEIRIDTRRERKDATV